MEEPKQKGETRLMFKIFEETQIKSMTLRTAS